MGDHLFVTEIFHSIQGESTRMGLPCVFVRLKGCHLRCVWCDTEYSFHEGDRRSIQSIAHEVLESPTPLVQVTGGEPLLQPGVHDLMSILCDAERTVLLETSGACDISHCDPRVIRIMDLKPPGSGESHRNDLANVPRLTSRDEVKFVIGDRVDYEWSRDLIREYTLHEKVAAILFSPVFPQSAGDHIQGHPGLPAATLAEWMLQDGLDARLQIQMHKSIWHPTARGV